MNQRLSAGQIWARGAVSALIATAVNLGVAVLASRLVDASPEFLALQPGPVATLTIVTVLAGTGVYAILTRVVRRPELVFTVIASLVALASLIAPISLSIDTSTFAGATPAAALALIPLHLIPAAVLIAALVWRRRAVAA